VNKTYFTDSLKSVAVQVSRNYWYTKYEYIIGHETRVHDWSRNYWYAKYVYITGHETTDTRGKCTSLVTKLLIHEVRVRHWSRKSWYTKYVYITGHETTDTRSACTSLVTKLLIHEVRVRHWSQNCWYTKCVYITAHEILVHYWSRSTCTSLVTKLIHETRVHHWSRHYWYTKYVYTIGHETTGTRNTCTSLVTNLLIHEIRVHHWSPQVFAFTQHWCMSCIRYLMWLAWSQFLNCHRNMLYTHPAPFVERGGGLIFQALAAKCENPRIIVPKTMF
jgi:hypothetical protein